MTAKPYDKLAQPDFLCYSPSLSIDRIWTIKADRNYGYHYRWKENGIPVKDSQHEMHYDKNVIVAIRTLSGKGLLALENKRFELQENTLIFFYINQPRLYKTLIEFWNLYWIAFKIDHIFFPLETVLHVNANAREKRFMNDVSQELRQNNAKYANAIFSAQLVNWVQRSYQYKKPQNILIDEITQYISQHYDQSINIEKLAHRFGLSSQYLRTIFHRETNMSPIQFITEIRIKNAKELLTTSDMKIEFIAEKIGFANQYYFSRCFKQHTGMTPGSWRTKNSPTNHSLL